MAFTFSNYKDIFICYLLAHLMDSPATRGTVCIVCLAAVSNLIVCGWNIKLVKRIIQTMICCNRAQVHPCKISCKSWAQVYIFPSSKAWHSPHL